MAMEPLRELSVAAECDRLCQLWREAIPDVMVENMAILIMSVGLAFCIGNIAAQCRVWLPFDQDLSGQSRGFCARSNPVFELMEKRSVD